MTSPRPVKMSTSTSPGADFEGASAEKGHRSPRPHLRPVQTSSTDAHEIPQHDLTVDKEAALMQAMTLESPAGFIASPTRFGASPASYSSTLSRQTTVTPSSPSTPISPTATTTTTTTTTQSTVTTSSSVSSKLQGTLQDVRHFAGGLITHPYEATRHYSILRHSHGLVYYSGSTTNLAITIFADRDLPADRTLWLQRKGFSGKAGLKIGGLLGARSTWVDVTPTVRAVAEQLNPSDERAWQRDIAKILKKAPKELRAHRVRETDILRIPCEADDGYLRVVLCTAGGKKVLCGSPIFRLASSSMDSSSLRGASLKTMPLEMGIKVASVVANNLMSATLTPAADTARTFVTGQVSQIYQPGFAFQESLTAAYDTTVQSKLETLDQQYDQVREGAYDRVDRPGYDALSRPAIIGDDSGPASPFPVRFHGKVVVGAGRSKAAWNMPTANLTNVAEDVLWKHKGVFFGWAAVNLPRKLAEETQISDEWRKAVIFISPDPDRRRSVVHKNTARVYLLHDFESATFIDAKLSVILMGYLRAMDELGPDQEPDMDARLFDFYKDIAITTASLDRPAWAAAATLERVRSASSSRSFTEKYVDLRQSTQRQIDRIPTQKLGLRTHSAVLRDRLVGNGGVWVPRQPLTHTTTV